MADRLFLGPSAPRIGISEPLNFLLPPGSSGVCHGARRGLVSAAVNIGEAGRPFPRPRDRLTERSSAVTFGSDAALGTPRGYGAEQPPYNGMPSPR